MSTQAVTPEVKTQSAVVRNLVPKGLLESPFNPRRTFDDGGMQELEASIRMHGVQEPLIVRQIEVDEEQIYEVVAGHRRRRAAMAAGLERVPCLVLELTDAEAREAAVTSNLQRVDVHPLEEAEAFDELLKVLGSVAAVAARLGKEQSYVAKVVKLTTLTLPSRDALRGGLITMEHALLLARLAEAEQNVALKWTLDPNAGVKMSVDAVLAARLERIAKVNAPAVTAVELSEDDDDDGAFDDIFEDEGDAGIDEDTGRRSMFAGYQWEPQSVAKLKSFIAGKSGIVLSRAPWSLTDEDYLLPDVGPCAACPKNTSANTPLFGDLDTGTAVCTDGACFAAKTAGFVHIELRKQGQDEAVKPKKFVPRLSWAASSVKPSLVSVDPLAKPEIWTANPAKVLKEGQWVEAKPGSCPHVRPGVTMDWSDAAQCGYGVSAQYLRKPGEVLQVCIVQGCKVHRKEWEKPKAATGNHYVKTDPAEEKRREEESAHVKKIEGEIRWSLLWAILGKMDVSKAVQLVAANNYNAAQWRKRLLEKMPELNGPTLEAFVVFCCEFDRDIQPNIWQLMQKDGVAGDRKDIFKIAKSVGLDGPQLVAKYFHDAGSIAPWSDRLYPKGIPWSKGLRAPEAAAKESVAKKAATAKPEATKTAAKKAAPAKAAKPMAAKGQKAKPAKLTDAARKKIAAAMKKRWAESRKKAVA